MMDLDRRREEMRAFFDEKADGYDEVHAAFMGTKRLLTTHLPEGTRRVLDLGAGTGLELEALFARFPEAEVTALDVSPEMLAALGKRPFAARVNRVLGDFFGTDFGGPYDAVISTSALHHFTREDKAVLYAKVFACLAPGGIFLNADKVAPSRAAEEADLAEYLEDPTRWRHMDTPLVPSGEMELLENAGFAPVEVTATDQDNYRLFAAVKPRA